MYVIKGNVLKISVRNLVEFLCRSGDIDSGSGSAPDVRVMQEGARLHRKIQKSMGSAYHAEVPLKMGLPVHAQDEQKAYEIHLEGRADGIICDMQEDAEGNRIPKSAVTVDEIKTMQADVKKLTEPIYVHKAQAMCYGYIYASQQHLSEITIQMTYCNPETEEIKRFQDTCTYTQITEWFDALLQQFLRWTDFVFDARRMRQQSIKGMVFPYPYRQGQRNLVVSVYKSIEQEKNLYIQASTGVGKTLSTVFPAVAAMGQNYIDKIFYLTSKTITRTVAQDTFQLLRVKGLQFRNVTLTARDKICCNGERKCTPLDCACAKGHFDRINDAVYDVITNNMIIDRECILEYAAKHNVCPFELSLDVSYWCDGIICDYNYVFDPNVALKRYFGEGSRGDYAFLVDEAHNLVDRAREMYSALLVKEDFLKIKKLVKETDKRLAGCLERCNHELLWLKRQCDTVKVLDDLGKLPASLERLFMAMQDFLEKHKNFPEKEEILTFFFDVRHFLNMYDCMDERYVIYCEHDAAGNFCLRLFCVDPSGNIALRLQQGRSTVFFSATLLPIHYFKEMLSGDVQDYAVYAESSFDTQKRCVIIGQDVSSRYTRRNVQEYRKICRYIMQTTAQKAGKYMVFFPSYSYMEAVRELFVSIYPESVLIDYDEDEEALRQQLQEKRTFIAVQRTRMREQDKEQFLALFDAYECGGCLIGFCVMGGAFSEGIDLRQDSLIGAIVIGTGLPMICRERDILRDYFDDCGKDGYAYAYVYPGMNKVLQAAGRVIRTNEDRGVIELLDDRFFMREYQALYPREWTAVYPATLKNVNKIVNDFWKNIVQ